MINTATVVGYLGGDPEIRKSNDGVYLATFSIACNERWKEKEVRRERTHWIRCKAFGGLARFCGEYLKKGSRIGARGALDYSTWETDEGERRSSLTLKVLELDWLDPKTEA